jgi:hypothetical protein
MDSARDLRKRRGFPIRTSADQRALASPRSFSQRATSFIASWRQGIHRTPFSYSPSNPHHPHAVPNRAHKQHRPHGLTHTYPDSTVKEQSRPGARPGPGWVCLEAPAPAGPVQTHPIRRPLARPTDQERRVEPRQWQRSKGPAATRGIRPSVTAPSLKGGDPAAGSPTATLLRLHPSH